MKQNKDTKWLEELMQKPTFPGIENFDNETLIEMVLLNRTLKKSKNKKKKAKMKIRKMRKLKLTPNWKWMKYLKIKKTGMKCMP